MPLKYKFAVAMTVAVLLIVGVGTWYRLSATAKLIRETLTAQAGASVQLFAQACTEGLLSRDLAGLSECVRQVGQANDVAYASIEDRRGNVLADTQIERVGRPSARESNRHIPSDGNGIYEVSTAVQAAGETWGQVRLGISLKRVNQAVAEARVEALVHAGLAILLGISVAMGLGWFLTRRLRVLTDATRAIARGEFSKRVQTGPQDEVGELGVAFNEMADKIDQHAAELEERVVERTAQLEAANKELEAFSYSVSHDLRAPLRAMNGFSRILLEKYGDQMSSEAQRYQNLIRDNAQQMGRLIDDLLAFSRLGRQALKRQLIAPAEIARLALDDLRHERNVRVQISIADLPNCQADPALLRQLFVNLLSNAIKFTRRREDARVEVGFSPNNGESVYFVKDNGVGFDMKYAEKLFGVFQRLHRAEEYEGTGVGLAIVQRIVNRHRGRVWAESALNKGATFYFTLGGAAS